MIGFLKRAPLHHMHRVSANINRHGSFHHMAICGTPNCGNKRKSMLLTSSTTNSQMQLAQVELYSQNTEGFDPDKPIRFSESAAKEWSSVETFTPPPQPGPWYQKWCILFGSTFFIVYFCLLREENDMDDSIQRSIFNRIPGLEERQIMVRMEYDKKHGNDTRALEARLAELQEADESQS